jgi:hypothetical protein
MATAAQRAKMDEAAAEVRRHMGPAVDWLRETEESTFGSWFLTDAEKSLLGNIRTEERRAAEWLSTWRGWAEKGQAPNGDAYPVDFYLRIGNDLANAFATYTREKVHAGAFVLGQAAAAAVGDLGTGLARAGDSALNVLDGIEDATKAIAAPWPVWVKLAGAAGAFGLAVIAIRELARKVPDLGAMAAPAAETGPQAEGAAP